MRRIFARGWLVFAPTVVVNALLQAATGSVSGVPNVDWQFILAFLVSFLALVAATTLVVTAASPSVSRLGRPTLLCCVITAVVVAATALSTLVSPLLVPLFLLASAIALPALVGRSGVPAAGLGVFRVAPGRSIALSIGTLLLIGVLWVGALLLGFFVTGFVAALLSWLAFGCAGVVLVVGWTSLQVRTRTASTGGSAVSEASSAAEPT
jgi:hypothetical protein